MKRTRTVIVAGILAGVLVGLGLCAGPIVPPEDAEEHRAGKPSTPDLPPGPPTADPEARREDAEGESRERRSGPPRPPSRS